MLLNSFPLHAGNEGLPQWLKTQQNSHLVQEFAGDTNWTPQHDVTYFSRTSKVAWKRSSLPPPLRTRQVQGVLWEIAFRFVSLWAIRMIRDPTRCHARIQNYRPCLEAKLLIVWVV